MIERNGLSAEIGTRLTESGQALIHRWNRLTSKSIQWAKFNSSLRALQGAILDALHEGALCKESRTAENCRRLGRRLYDSIKAAVKAALNRKTCYATHSEKLTTLCKFLDEEQLWTEQALANPTVGPVVAA